MRVIHIISTLNLGGAENFVVQFANQQSETDEIIVVVLRQSDGYHNYISKINARIKLIQLDWKKKYSGIQFIELDRILKIERPDIIHVHLHNPLYYVYGLSFIRKKYKYVHTMHNSFTIWKPVMRLCNRLRFLNNSVLHICVSRSIYEELKLNFPKLKTTYVENGIQRYQPLRSQQQVKDYWNQSLKCKETDFKFLMIANNSPFKNVSLLIDACKILQMKYPQIKCLVVGNVSEEKRISENIFFSGVQNDAADFITQADALCVVSTEEGMPIVALEALSLGVPVISTPAGGMKDVVNHGYNGFITKDFTIESFCNNVLTFLRLSEEERKLLKLNAKDSFSKKYSINQVHQSYLKAYKAL
ncbi:glycosyltransferase [Aquimarina sp. MMG015]|uniref:glycosyltransferase n=1 Tax=Aquimarina sp. MMG015 TaxID=2822689 RepID=UPI001B39E917|nr:glycosyltransferase [Aquimarina sp. MMG015]MBQ4802997.1 glycosyltransferase [Aquimarina sp. MMG015]